MAIVDEIPLPVIAQRMAVSMSAVRRAIAPIKQQSKVMAAQQMPLTSKRKHESIDTPR